MADRSYRETASDIISPRTISSKAASKVTLAIFALSLMLPFQSTNASQIFWDSKLDSEKQEYCERVVKQFGYWSYKHNRTNRYLKNKLETESLLPVRPNNWVMVKMKKPGWFSKTLLIYYEQDNGDGYKHRAYCTWDENGDFVFSIWNSFTGGDLWVCTLPINTTPSCPKRRK